MSLLLHIWPSNPHTWKRTLNLVNEKKCPASSQSSEAISFSFWGNPSIILPYSICCLFDPPNKKLLLKFHDPLVIPRKTLTPSLAQRFWFWCQEAVRCIDDESFAPFQHPEIPPTSHQPQARFGVMVHVPWRILRPNLFKGPKSRPHLRDKGAMNKSRYGLISRGTLTMWPLYALNSHKHGMVRPVDASKILIEPLKLLGMCIFSKTVYKLMGQETNLNWVSQTLFEPMNSRKISDWLYFYFSFGHTWLEFGICVQCPLPRWIGCETWANFLKNPKLRI